MRSVNGFEEAVRQFGCRVVSVTYQNIAKDVLVRLLGGASGKDTLSESDPESRNSTKPGLAASHSTDFTTIENRKSAMFQAVVIGKVGELWTRPQTLNS